MSSSTVTPIRPSNPFETARLALIKKLLAVKAPASFSVFPVPGEFTSVVDHLREAAGIFDEWLAAIGHEITDNSSSRVDMGLFRSAFTDAVDGNAMWEVEKQGEQLVADHNDMLRAS
jgi:hypothetical protein